MSAIDGIIVILANKGYYRPNEPVELTIQAAVGTQVQAQISYLTSEIASLTAPLVDGQAVLQWLPPPDAPKGYGVNVTVLDAAGQTLATQTSAFDVLNRWIDAPRYGFFSDFSPARLGGTDEETAAWLRQHHINGVQFYDWQYRWEDLLPDTERFEDGLGRPQSMKTVRRLIDLLHGLNIAAMPYTAIYGASSAFYRQHPTWGFFDATGKVYDFGENSFIGIMNPAPGSEWNTHLLGEFADVLRNTTFDGIHIDQYGSPKTGYDDAGNYLDLAVIMPQFINQTAAVVDELRGDAGVVLFNCVGNWPIKAVAGEQQDAAYIEVWSPNNDYMDLSRIITNAEKLGNGKAVILAAYIPPERTINWHLANAVILASGGTHLETGELNSMLADPYFPRFGKLEPEQFPLFRRFYDFQVRYENVLSTTTTAGSSERQAALELADIRTHGIRSQDRVVPLLRVGDGFETLNLVNFVGVMETDWNAPTTQTPTVLENLAVKFSVTRPVARVWVASPDDEATMNPVLLQYTVADGVLAFKLPSLRYWSMIVVEYADVR